MATVSPGAASAAIQIIPANSDINVMLIRIILLALHNFMGSSICINYIIRRNRGGMD